MQKRVFDLTVSTAALLILSPLLVTLALLVKLTTPGPVFYRAIRVGRNGTTFNLLKFRSMVVNADKIGPAVTGATDPRVTPIGRFLRRSKLDELPQLVNVLRGQMSIVGPRPEDPRYVALYTDAQRKILSVRPGITSPASVAYRNEEAILTGADWERTYIRHVMPAKLAIDLDYVGRDSLRRDMRVILETLRGLFV
jgi:lipopolysaccharide/colanic/teichoic acid biosynthesis glycosyltransferase